MKRNYITAKELANLTGFSLTTIHELQSEEENDFPAPIRLTSGPKAHRRWLESDIYEWLDGLQDHVVDDNKVGAA